MFNKIKKQNKKAFFFFHDFFLIFDVFVVLEKLWELIFFIAVYWNS